jgi:Putative zinc-finger
VTHADQGQHLDDETLSASIDDRLAPNDAAGVQAHLGTCQACRERLEDLQSVVGLLRQLPLLEPPRPVWGPRLVADPPNVVRLRRVYTLARAGAAALAAVFVLSSAGALYEAATAPSPRRRPIPPSRFQLRRRRGRRARLRRRARRRQPRTLAARPDRRPTRLKWRRIRPGRPPAPAGCLPRCPRCRVRNHWLPGRQRRPSRFRPRRPSPAAHYEPRPSSPAFSPCWPSSRPSSFAAASRG